MQALRRELLGNRFTAHSARLKLKLHDKLNASANLGNHLGLLSERHLLGGLDSGDLKQTQHMEVVFVESKRSR
jgi:hypothetical protein